MPRHSLLRHRHTRASTQLVRHVAARQRVYRRMRATTPVRFLQRLALIDADERAEPYVWPFDDVLLEEVVGPAVVEDQPIAAPPNDESASEEDALITPRMRVASEVRMTSEVPATPEVLVKRPRVVPPKFVPLTATRPAAGSKPRRVVPAKASAAMPAREAGARTVETDGVSSSFVAFAPERADSKQLVIEPTTTNIDDQRNDAQVDASTSSLAVERESPDARSVVAPSTPERESYRDVHTTESNTELLRTASSTAIQPDIESLVVEPPRQTAALSAPSRVHEPAPDIPDTPVRAIRSEAVQEPSEESRFATESVAPRNASTSREPDHPPAEPAVDPASPVPAVFVSPASPPIKARAADMPAAEASAPEDRPAPAQTRGADPAVAPSTRMRHRARVEERVVDNSRSEAAAPRPSAPRVAGKKNQEPTPPVGRESDRLFQPQEGVDNSPAAWAARLANFLRQPRTTSPSPATQVPAPAPTPAAGARQQARSPVQHSRSSDVRIQLPESTRRFLKPLVGIDPMSVDIWTGPVSTAITKANRADALAINDETILVGLPIDSQSARDTSLLAHELTHIARQRERRFVPPILAQSPAPPGAVEDEESVALRVEARVAGLTDAVPVDAAPVNAVPVNAVPVNVAPVNATTVPPPSARGDARVAPDGPAVAVEQGGNSANAASVGSVPAQSTPARVPEWGNLPPPWEPMPEWTVNLTAPAPAVATPIQYDAQSVGVSRATDGAASAASNASPVTVQRAEEGRTAEPSQESAAASPVPAAAVAPAAPDLDVLAREVYAVLKRRLDAEARRELLS